MDARDDGRSSPAGKNAPLCGTHTYVIAKFFRGGEMKNLLEKEVPKFFE